MSGGSKHWGCDLAAAEGSCGDRATLVKTGKEPGALSPDKKSEAFIRDWNLWLRDVASGKETQLTTDGVEDFGYATDNAGRKHTDKAIVDWSPDAERTATFQQNGSAMGMERVGQQVEFTGGAVFLKKKTR